VLNTLAVAAWLLIARKLGSWPEYGYCDFPEVSWVLLFWEVQRLMWVFQLIVLLVVTIRAIRRRDPTVAAAVGMTAAVWLALALHDFNPNAVPGDGCLA
jgi:hypothetical protein